MSDQMILSHTFPNGLTVLIEPMAEVQSAAFSLMVPAGAVYDHPGREGGASVLTDWIMRGAGPRDSQRLTNDLDNLGLQRNEATGTTHLTFGGATLAENLPEAMRIYADVVRRPHLPEDEFDPARAGAQQALAAIEDEPRQKIMVELRRRCYEAPWGLPPEGSFKGLENLTPEDGRGLFERCVRPADSILGIAGNVHPQAMLDLAAELFGDWDSRPGPSLARGPAGLKRDHIPHESTQTQIGIAYPSVPYGDSGYYEAWALVGVLSGGSSSRLFTEVRERRGLCYSVYATLNSLRDRGTVLGYAGTTVERAQETLDVTLAEILRLKEGIGEDELERCKARAKSSLIMQQESSSSRASAIARDWYFLGRVTTLDEVRREIESLTVPRLMGHLQSHPAQDFTILTLGPAPLTSAVV
jgi:predicted Zn-dependent peptidase